MMLEIDCRKCANCDMANGLCKRHGKDPEKAVQKCAADGFASYEPVK